MIDFHMHTTNSDGILSVKELIDYINQTELEYFSITDHESVDAYYDKYIKNSTKKIIPGMEITVWYYNTTIDLLIYNFDIEKVKNSKYVNKEMMEQRRIKRFQQMVDHSRGLGLILEDYNLKETDYSLSCTLFKLINREENKWFLELNDYSDDRYFFRKLSGEGGEFNLDYSHLFPSLKEIVEFVHSMGGIVVLAHPYIYNFNDVHKFVISAIKDGVDGVEVFYPRFDPKEKKKLIKYCSEHNVLMTAGGDYHYGKKEDIIGKTYEKDFNIWNGQRKED